MDLLNSLRRAVRQAPVRNGHRMVHYDVGCNPPHMIIGETILPPDSVPALLETFRAATDPEGRAVFTVLNAVAGRYEQLRDGRLRPETGEQCDFTLVAA